METKPKRPGRSPERGGRWAVLGGVFDPVHYGHLTLADDLYKAEKYDGILLVPSFSPPHKNHTTAASYADRLAMLRLAVQGKESYVLSEIESEMDQPGYTVNTVRALKTRYPKATFYFIIGADNIGEIRSWYHPEEIFQEVEVVAGARPGFRPDQSNGPFAERIRLVPTGMVDVSSSEIRQKIRDGITIKELSKLVPSRVAEYIDDRRLYR